MRVERTSTGRQALDQLRNSPNIYTIDARNLNGQGNGAKPSNVQAAQPQPSGQPGAGFESTIEWDPNETQGGTNDAGSTTRDPSIGLGHEMGHAADVDSERQSFNIDPQTSGTSPPSEQGRSMRIENEMRQDQNEPARSQYYR